MSALRDALTAAGLPVDHPRFTDLMPPVDRVSFLIALFGELYKTCSRCGAVKPLDDFYRTKHGRYGRRGECIACFNVRMLEHKSRRLTERSIA